MTSNLSELLEIRLQDWADWYGKQQDFGMGYPRESLEYKLWRDGVLVRVKGIAPQPDNPYAEEMEMWICLLQRNVGKDVREAICEKYMAPRLMSISKIADKLEISVKTLEYRINTAKKFLLGCLAGNQFAKVERAA